MLENNLSEQQDMSSDVSNQNESKKKKKIFSAVILSVVIILSAIIIFFLSISQNKDEKVLLNIQPDIEQQKDSVKKDLLPIRYGKMWLEVTNEKIQVGDEIEVKILMDTKESDINVAKAVVKFDKTYLKFIGGNSRADVKDSVLEMGVLNSFADNKIEVIRAMPGDADYLDSDDGFNGNRGLLAKLKFKVLRAGETELIFKKGCLDSSDNCEESMMILDDGNGTVMQVEFEDLDLKIN